VSSSPAELSEGGRIVIAEDDPGIAGALSWLLREQGYSVVSVDGRESLFANMERAVADLVLLDADMIEQDNALLTRLRGDDRWRDVRVIVAAPAAASDKEVPVLPAGADDYVNKPFRVPELLGRVRTQLRASDQLRTARAALREAAAELERAREDAISNRRLIDILHEVTGEMSATEIYRLLTRRLARVLQISHCSIVLARVGDPTGTIAAAAEDAAIRDVSVRLDRYPEINAALESGRPVLVQDAHVHPLFAGMRAVWAEEKTPMDMRSVVSIPFSIDRWRSGVLFLRTNRAERALTPDDVDFADVALRAAVAAVRRAQALETTRADNRRLEALATTDPLTRVLNRRALLDRLATELDRVRRYQSTLSLLLLDVDHFKQINDTAGHLAGDSVLRQIGALLQEAVRTVDVVARYGGEEFVTLLPETSDEGATAFAERLRERIAAQPFEVGGDEPVHLTVSIGIASFPSPGVESTDDLFARADGALYRAKSAGRNQVHV